MSSPFTDRLSFLSTQRTTPSYSTCSLSSWPTLFVFTKNTKDILARLTATPHGLHLANVWWSNLFNLTPAIINCAVQYINLLLLRVFPVMPLPLLLLLLLLCVSCSYTNMFILIRSWIHVEEDYDDDDDNRVFYGTEKCRSLGPFVAGKGNKMSHAVWCNYSHASKKKGNKIIWAWENHCDSIFGSYWFLRSEPNEILRSSFPGSPRATTRNFKYKIKLPGNCNSNFREALLFWDIPIQIKSYGLILAQVPTDQPVPKLKC